MIRKPEIIGARWLLGEKRIRMLGKVTRFTAILLERGQEEIAPIHSIDRDIHVRRLVPKA